MSLRAGGFAKTREVFADDYIRTRASSGHGHSGGFSALAPLAQLFEINEASAKNFSELLAALPSDRKSQIQKTFGERALIEISCIAQEPNREVFYYNLQELARRLDNDERPAAALRVRQYLAEYAPLPKVSQEAGEHLAAMRGEGPRPLRAKLFLDRLGSEFANPGPVVGFGAGSALFRLTRLAALSQIIARPAGLLTRGWGAETLAALAGLSIEAPAMVLGTKLGDAVFKKTPLDLQNFYQETLHATVMLTPLKALGYAGGQATQSWIRSENLLSRVSRAAIPQASMWLGILGGSALWQLHEPDTYASKDHWLAASLETLLHYNVAGVVARSWLGRGFQSWEASLDGYARQLARESPPPSFWPGNLGIQLAFAGPHSRIGMREDPKTAGLSLMTGGRGTAWQSAEHDSNINIELPPRGMSLEDVRDALGYQWRVAPVFFHTKIRNVERLRIILGRLDHALRFSSEKTAEGNYINWMTRVAFETSVAQDKVEKFDSILALLHDGGTLRVYEKAVAELLPPARLQSWPHVVSSLLKTGAVESKWIATLPFSSETLAILRRWAATVKRLPPNDPPFLAPETLLATLSDYPWTPQETQAFEAAVKLGSESPLALFRFQRLDRILSDSDGLTLLKLREMGDPNLHLEGHSPSRWRFLNFLRSHPLKLRNTQFDAYMDHPEPLMLLYEIQRRWPKLLDENAAEKRAEVARAKLTPILAGLGEKNFLAADDITRGLETLGDPYSLKIAKEIKKEEFIFEITEASKYAERFRHYRALAYQRSNKDFAAAPKIEPEDAYYFPPGTTGEKGVMLMKSPNMTEHEGMEKMKEYFFMLKKSVHEYKHHRDMKPQLVRTRETELRDEMMASGREYLWAAEHGDIDRLRDFHREGFTGFALHFRDAFEKLYPIRR